MKITYVKILLEQCWQKEFKCKFVVGKQEKKYNDWIFLK